MDPRSIVRGASVALTDRVTLQTFVRLNSIVLSVLSRPSVLTEFHLSPLSWRIPKLLSSLAPWLQTDSHTRVWPTISQGPSWVRPQWAELEWMPLGPHGPTLGLEGLALMNRAIMAPPWALWPWP